MVIISYFKRWRDLNMAYEKTQDTEEIVKRIIHYMVNKLEEEGCSKEEYFFNFEKTSGLKNKEEAIYFIQCSEDDFYKALNKCIARSYVSNSYVLDGKYTMLCLLASEVNSEIKNTNIHVHGGFNQFGNGNTQNKG